MRNTDTCKSQNLIKHELRLYVTLDHFLSTFQAHVKNLYKSDFRFSEDVLGHSYFQSVTLKHFWIISQALCNHISTKKGDYMPFYWLCSFGSILKRFSSTFKSHLCKEGHVHAFVFTMQLWIYSEAFLQHISITSLQRRTCTCLRINYAALYLFWSISPSLFNHISSKKDIYMPMF
jgi:hypothetical protein